MAEWYKGRRFSTREEDGDPPIPQEELDRANAAFEEFDAKRKAVPEEKRIHLSERFGDNDYSDEPPPGFDPPDGWTMPPPDAPPPGRE
ncbi:hypothetical protein [Nocardia wallacei]|uniref:hypothetical protein n=1 Tax=Nocardia wallacei TaxID=480035 RepID=UPI00245823B5|nr:hypothetical protein [Nocardia wallacei]